MRYTSYIYIVIGMLLMTFSIHASANNVVWYNGTGAVAYSLQEHVSPVVKVALSMFSDDMKAVTGHQAEQRNNAPIDIIQLDMLSNKEFKKLNKRRLPYEKIIAKREAFYMGCHAGKLFVIGSDARGTAYGILELSRMAGVSPWVWWGDVVPEKRKILQTSDSFSTIQWPSVEYRGIFINDEDWSLRVWAHQKMDKRLPEGTIGPRTYKKLFELLLRLRANTLWPAMHEGTKPFFQVKGNREVADSCAIVIGSSHCEPMLRNNVGEWNRERMGDFNYMTNRRRVQDYWTERVKETSNMDALYTLGMRGIHDGSMEGVKTLDEKTKALQQVIDDQRHILAKHINKDVADIPQVFIPYKEVLDILENGLQVPDDVTLMWCDDNYGYMTRLSDEQQQRRSGGAGVYYHLSYWGRPHDYLWLTTTQPGLIVNEMKTAYEHHARRLWIANVHDPKVAAYDLSLFLDMAWNINSVKRNNVEHHLGNWLQQQFGAEAGKLLLPVMAEYYHLTTIRKPEFMGWSQVELDKKKFPRGLSPAGDTEFNAVSFGNELEAYLYCFENQKEKILAVEKKLRPELRDAFFAAVKY
ncbi:MAG: glycosyl hydrolase 115 family protein, partial [Prevotella sp.]|nr:glycosyl hydrolase 115 family protein [Prevotella sp.]